MRELSGMEAREVLGLWLVKRRQETRHEYGCPLSAGIRGVGCFCWSGEPQVFVMEEHFRGGETANDDGQWRQWGRPGNNEPLLASRPLALAPKSCTVEATTSEEDANGI